MSPENFKGSITPSEKFSSESRKQEILGILAKESALFFAEIRYEGMENTQLKVTEVTPQELQSQVYDAEVIQKEIGRAHV